MVRMAQEIRKEERKRGNCEPLFEIMERLWTSTIGGKVFFNLNFWEVSHVSIHEDRSLLSFPIKRLELGQSHQFLR